MSLRGAKRRGNLYKYIPFTLFIFLIFLRFYKSVEWFAFNFDEEYQALMAWSQIKDFHPIWIGVSASNFGFYLGPAFTYLNAFLFWISKGDVSILAYFSSLFGIVTILSLYFVASRLFSRKISVLSTLIYGFSALLIYFDRRFWNPTPIMFITIWLLYSFYQAESDTRWYILSAVLLAVSVHVHLSLLVYWPLFIYLLLRNFRKISLKTWALGILSYLFLVFPLIIFDINHNFDNIVGPIKFLLGERTGDSAFNISKLIQHFKNIFSSTSRLIFLKFFTNIQEEHGLGAHGALMAKSYPLLRLITLLIFLWFSIRSLFEQKFKILSLMTLSIMSLYILYPQWGAEYYLLSFFILFCLISGIVLEKISWRILIPIFSIFIILNSLTILTTTQSKYGLLARRNLINQVMAKIGDNPFSLETIGNDPRKYHPYGGWKYLFQTYGRTPISSFADEFFGWIYPEEKTDVAPKYKVVVAEEKQLNCQPDCLPVYSGAFNAYIFPLK